MVVPEDVARVVQLYQRHLALGDVRAWTGELDRQGIVSKHRTTAGGVPTGGKRYFRGALYALLSNAF